MAAIGERQRKAKIERDGDQHVEGVLKSCPEFWVCEQPLKIPQASEHSVGRQNVPVGKARINADSQRQQKKQQEVDELRRDEQQPGDSFPPH